MKYILILIAAMACFSCVDRDRRGKVLDTPTSGSIKIVVDESLKPLIDAEIEAFEAIYQNAKIEVTYTSEGEAIDGMIQDSARLAIITRKLVDDEVKLLHSQAIVPYQLTVAKSGVALITNKSTRDSIVNLASLKALLSGQEKPASSSLLQIKHVVFDQPNSGIIRFLKDTLMITGHLPANCFAVKGNAAVVDYVTKVNDTMGLIDVSWISDHDDSTATAFLSSIKVISVLSDSGAYQPYQAYLAQDLYPLMRNITIISREARAGLGSGFMAFVASDKGQRIALKAGLVPATMPIRIIEINHEPF
jgi:phosphate transport system substrate-binding protein